MKKTILICKGGSVYRTRAAAKGNAVGEQGETEGLINHLLTRPDINLVYFGRYDGEAPEGLTIVEPSLLVKDHWGPAALQQEGFDLDVTELKHYEPRAFIQTAGYAPTFSMIDNPNGASVQCAAINYTAPMHNALNVFKIPRVVINNDPRTYPRDQEMSMGWPYSRPVALLDQQRKEWKKVVGGVKYNVGAVHSRCESWAYHERLPNTDEISCTAVAHAHFKDGIGTGDESTWWKILNGGAPPGFKIYGKGWDKSALYDDSIMPGPVKPEEALDLMQRSTCGPVISHSPGFYTGKPYVMMSRGCIPLIYGRTGDRVYDPNGLFLPLDSHWRIDSSKSFLSIVRQLEDNPSLREEMRAVWRRVLQPDFTMLDRLVDKIVAEDDIDTGEFGGYRKA